MTELDPAAIAAARKAVKAAALFDPIADVSTLADPAVRAYLAALGSPPVSAREKMLTDALREAVGALYNARYSEQPLAKRLDEVLKSATGHTYHETLVSQLKARP